MSESASRSDRHEVSQAPPPYVDCIQWVPRRFSGGASPTTIADLVFTQSALEAVHSSIAAAPESPVLGAMIGSVFEDPTCARRWVRVERILPGPSTVSENATVEDLAQAMRALGTVDSPASIVGWYRSHHQAGLYLSPEEAEFHEQGFPAPWAFALIVAGTSGRLAGGVFQRTDPEGLSRSVYTPFYELTDGTVKVGGSARRTTVAWNNYQTEARVVRPGEPESPTVMTMPGLPAASSKPAAEDSADAALADARSGEVGLTVVTDDTPAVPQETARVAQETTAASPDSPPAVLTEAEADAREHVSPAVAGLPLLNSPGAPPAPPASPERTADELAEAESQREAEAEWEKIQIQRSLTAVGRSLGPSTISELGAPAPETPTNRPRKAPLSNEKRDAGTPDPSTPVRPDLKVIDGQGSSSEAASSDGIIPITGPVPISDGGGLVGRSRRRRQIPVARIAMAAVGVTLMAAAGWVGTQTLGARGMGVVEGGDGSGESAVAGLSLAPGDMFADDERDEGENPVDPAIESDAALDSTSGAETQAQTAGKRLEETFEELSPLSVVVDSGTDVEPVPDTPSAGDDGAPPIEAPLPPEVIEAPVLDSLEIVDPTLSAYETALSIFRTEAERYEEVRREFDEGLMTCNPLNLAFRGALEAYTRLERRHDDIQPGLTGAAARAYAAAGRQYAVARTHYELTDCPMPVGG